MSCTSSEAYRSPDCRQRKHDACTGEDLLGTATECAAMLTAWAGIPVSVDAVHGYVRRCSCTCHTKGPTW